MAAEKTTATKSNSSKQTAVMADVSAEAHQAAFIWEVGHEFKVVTNIRQASVTRSALFAWNWMAPGVKWMQAIKWLEKNGVNVEPVEINVIES